MDVSKFHFFSFGLVSANKKRGTDVVEVFPQETFTMSAGELTDNVESVDVKGKDAAGKDYQGSVEAKATLTCKWLPIGEPNRVTSPDVRRNEQVIIYRYADTDFYFWSTAFNNIIRKLETAVWWFSGTPEDGAGAETERNGENGYFVQISTHDKNIILSTSQKNGEKVKYVLQFDMANGNFMLQDSLGNSIDLDSVAGKLTTTTENEVIANTKIYRVNCEQYEVNASTSAKFNTPILSTSKDFKVSGASLLVGYANFTTGIGGGGSGDETAPLAFKGDVTQVGSWNTIGAFGIRGDFKVIGTGEFSGNITAPNI